MTRRIFVSGGNGVIGNALVRALHRRGDSLFVGDLKPRPSDWPVGIRYRQGDLNYLTVAELQEFRPQVLVHLAATFERSTESYDFWPEDYHHNVRLSHHLADIVKDSAELESVVFASSYLVYDSGLYLFNSPQKTAVSLSDQSAILPRNLCGAAKFYHEAELAFIKQFHPHVQTVSARIFRSFGRNSRDVISRWIRALLANQPLSVFRIQGLFDYIFADDVAEGLIRLLDAGAEGVVNLGSGHARSVADVLDVLRGFFPDLRAVEEPSDIPFEASQADMSRMQAITGWTPQTTLEQAIQTIIAHERERPCATAEQQPLNVLVTSSSAEIPQLSAIRTAMRKIGAPAKLWGGDMDPRALSRHFVDDFWVMPPLDDLTPQAFAAFCMANEIDTVIPTRDGELVFFSENRADFASRCIRIMVSPPEAVSRCLDKLEFARLCSDWGFPAVPTALDPGELTASCYVVKERFGAGSRDIGLALMRGSALDHAAKLTNPVFQPFVEGREISIDLYVTEAGDVKGCVARTRDLVVHGESKITTVFRDEKLEKMACELVRRLGLRYHVMVQVIVDAAGVPHILECNCRFGGASGLSVATGLDSFYWFFLERNEPGVESYRFVGAREGLRQIRYETDRIE